MPAMKCELCGGSTTKKKVTKQHWLDGRLFLVENVESEVCTECGERYFHATTLDAIDAMLRGKHAVKQTMEVEVVSLK
jgi:YgiT-type zinc finger domain-containing protein